MTDGHRERGEGSRDRTVPALELLFANQDALVDYLRVPLRIQSNFLAATGDSQRDMAIKQHALTRELESDLASDSVPELQRLLLRGEVSAGAVIAIEQAMYFARQSDGRHTKFHAKLDSDPAWRVEGLIDQERFPFASTSEAFRHRNRVFVVGSVIGVQENLIRIRAFFIGRRRWSDSPDRFAVEPRRVYPQQVDHFADVDWATALTRDEFRRMNQMAEADVKEALAKVVGTPFVDKDWGGERSDAVTNNLMVDGALTSAAWLLKGRSVQGMMYMSSLGKRGDQLERLSTEPAELLVVQHNNQIASAVVNTARAFASDMRNPRRFMILDGDATAKILRDNGELK